MTISVQQGKDNEVLIKITGKFDFSLHTEFRDAYKCNNEQNRFVIDLSQTDYLDSSALGMLLLLREHVNNDTGKIEIRNCSPDIKKIFTIANFQKLFSIS